MDRTEFKSSTLLILLAALVAGILGLYFGGKLGSKGATFTNTVLLYPQPRPLPPFALQQPDGTPFGPANLGARWSVLFFGFRNCPDVCPTTLAQLAEVQRRLAASLPPQRLPQFVFISVDPARDSGAGLAEYTRYFNPALLAATTTEPDLGRFAAQLGAQYIAQPADAQGNYSVDHSADLFLIGPDGQRRGLIRPPFDTAGLVRDLETLSQ